MTLKIIGGELLSDNDSDKANAVDNDNAVMMASLYEV